MKKNKWLLVGLLALMLLVPVAVLAADEAAGAAFFTWEGIGTYSGAVALVVFMVQALKLPLDKVWKIPTRLVVYVVSLCVLLLAQIFVPALGGLTWETGILCVFNAFLVALAAMSTYEVMIGNVELHKVIDYVSAEHEDGKSAEPAQATEAE